MTILSGQFARYPGHQNLEANLRVYPSPIFVASIIGVEKLLRIDLDPTQGPVSFVQQALDRLPEGVLAIGKPIGVVINYSRTRRSGSIETGNQTRSWIRRSVQGPPFFSGLEGVRTPPRNNAG